MKFLPFHQYVGVYIALIILVQSSIPVLAQQKKKVFLTDLIVAAIESDKDTSFVNLEISMPNLSALSIDRRDQAGFSLEAEDHYLTLGEFLKMKLPNAALDENNQIIIPHKVDFKECRMSGAFDLNKLNFKDQLTFINCDFEALMIESSSFNEFGSFGNQYNSISIHGSQFIGDLYFNNDKISDFFSAEQNELSSRWHFDVESSGGDFYFTGNSFLNDDKIELFSVSNDSLLYGRSWTVRDRVDVFIRGNPVFFIFSDNKSDISGYNETSRFLGNFKNFELSNNDLHGILSLSTTADYYRIVENNFAYFDIGTSSFSETQNVIDWEQFDGNKMMVTNLVDYVNDDANGFESLNFLNVGLVDSTAMKSYGKYQSRYFVEMYLGRNDLEMTKKRNYKQILRSYYRLYSAFKAEGDIVSANACYVEMKDFETRKLKYNYNQQGGFDNLFRWRLNSLLKVYTDYGTNPAKAVRISFYIIFVFGVFYFFFPSEWDKASKKNMLLDFQKFIRKNDHGYIRPFFKLILAILLSLINGLILSLNAFVTLGFGKIPTEGFPRYICIIQGFIGWFLLSIFTVALINQVLF